MENILFTPFRIGTAELRNRVLFPSMCMFYCDNEGYITDRYISFVMERVTGGVGAFIAPGIPYGKPNSGRAALNDDRFIPGWNKLAEHVHKQGAKIIAQLHPVQFDPPKVKNRYNPSDYSHEVIREIIDGFASAALRAKKAGVDCVEIHGAHGHEIAAFTSPYYNKRTDEYGTDYKGRAKLGCDIVREIKKICGDEYPVIYRLNGDDKIEGGLTVNDAAKLAQLFENAGADAIHVSGGLVPNEQYTSASMDFEDCMYADDAAYIKERVTVPVIAVGRIVDIEQGRKIVQDGKADMVAMGRALLADPQLINKAAGKNNLPVRRCVGCNQGCRDVRRYQSIQCMQNPLLGREYTFMPPKKRETSDIPNVMIVGAGPGGLEAACVLAQYGIKPSIYDRENKPGGALNLSVIAPHKQNIDSITQYRKSLLDYYGVEIHLETDVDKNLILSKKPDILILATGSEPFVPAIPGLDVSSALTGDDVLRQKNITGKRIAVIGGGLVGCEAAEFLREQGKEVEIFEMQSILASEMFDWKRTVLLERMRDSGIISHTDAKVTAINLPDITVEAGGKQAVLHGFDNVVVTVGRTPNRTLAGQLDGLGIKIYEIGDIKKPLFAIDAIRDGYDAAMDILTDTHTGVIS